MAVKAIPDGYGGAVPELAVRGASRAIEFYTQAFEAKEQYRFEGPNSVILHADLLIGGRHVMLADEMPQMGSRSPESLGGSPVRMMLYVEDVDTVFQRALNAGAEQVFPVRDEFWGDRAGTLRDPFGHLWMVATHREEVPPDELRRRGEEMLQQFSK